MVEKKKKKKKRRERSSDENRGGTALVKKALHQTELGAMSPPKNGVKKRCSIEGTAL